MTSSGPILRIPQETHERAKLLGMDAEELWHRNVAPDPQHDRKRQQILKAKERPLATMLDAFAGAPEVARQMRIHEFARMRR